MFLNKIKQNLAGFAVAVVAFSGLTAVTPASATVYASNAGSVADPSSFYSYNGALTLDSNNQGTYVAVAGNSSFAVTRNVSLLQAQSAALSGQSITFELSVTNGSTTWTPAQTNVNLYFGGAYLNPTSGTGLSATYTWPTTGFGANDYISFTSYNNSMGSDAIAAGTYTVTAKIKANGVALTSSQVSNNSMSYSSNKTGAVSGTLPAGANLSSIGYGKVCVNPASIAVGDVLTARPIVNGAVQNASNFSTNYWTTASSSLGSGVTRTVISADLNGIAFSSNFGAYSAGVNPGAAFTADLSITNGSGTEVTYPCPTPTVGTVALTSSSTTSVVGAVTGGGDSCRLLRQMGQMWAPTGGAPVVNGVCTITPFMPLSAATYELQVSSTGFWSTTPVTSTNNPQFTIASNGSSNSNSNSNNNVQQQVQQSAPVVPTNIPLVAPIAAPKLGVTPGAALVLSGANMSTVSSIKIDSTATTTKTTVGGVEIQVPANLTPGAHDLLITTTTGSTLYVGAIKVADPMVVAAKQAVAKAAASIAYRAPVDLTVGKAVSAAQASQVKALASQYRGAKTAICEAIPASKATVASARAAAVAVCATIKAAIPGVKTLIVIGAPSGAKSNRVSSEIQG